MASFDRDAAINLANELTGAGRARREQLDEIEQDMANRRDPSPEVMEKLWLAAYQECFVQTPERKLLWQARELSGPQSGWAVSEAIAAYASVDPSEGLEVLKTSAKLTMAQKVECYSYYGKVLGEDGFKNTARQLALSYEYPTNREYMLMVVANTASDPESMRLVMESVLTDFVPPKKPQLKQGRLKINSRADLNNLKLQIIAEQQGHLKQVREVQGHNNPTKKIESLIELSKLGYLPAIGHAKSMILENTQIIPVTADLDAYVATLLLAEREIGLGKIGAIGPEQVAAADKKVDDAFLQLAEESPGVAEILKHGTINLGRAPSLIENRLLELWQQSSKASRLSREGLAEYVRSQTASFAGQLAGTTNPSLSELVRAVNAADYSNCQADNIKPEETVEQIVTRRALSAHRRLLGPTGRMPISTTERQLQREHQKSIDEQIEALNQSMRQINELCLFMAMPVLASHSKNS